METNIATYQIDEINKSFNIEDKLKDKIDEKNYFK